MLPPSGIEIHFYFWDCCNSSWQNKYSNGQSTINKYEGGDGDGDGLGHGHGHGHGHGDRDEMVIKTDTDMRQLIVCIFQFMSQNESLLSII